MTDDMLPIERAMLERYGKFLPAICPDFRLPNRTRVLLEYDDTGAFIERDHVTGEIVDVGRLWMSSERREAA
jgi:hypothetical protein